MTFSQQWFDCVLQMKRFNFELNVQLSLPKNGVTALLGPSGSGKTSLLRLLAGLDQGAVGYIRAGNTVWFDHQHRIYLPPQLRRVGLVFQEYALFDHLTVWQNIAYGVAKSKQKVIVKHWLQRTHLTELANSKPAILSGGQRQRVALARALAHEPDVLLLDEPFAALDIQLRDRLRREIQGLIQGLDIPVLLVTHDLLEAQLMADNIGVLIDGRLRQFGECSQVFAEPKEVDVARVLGWKNFLKINKITDGKVIGDWGEIQLSRAIPENTRYLGFRAHHARLSGVTGCSIRGIVVSLARLDALFIVEIKLVDKSLLVLHLTWTSAIPSINDVIEVQLISEYVRFFNHN